MKRIDLYLGRALITGAALALLALVAIDAVIELVDEVADVDDDYTLGDALCHTGLMLIASIYELLPVAVLIGGVVSLGNLAAQSELVAFRTLRYSRARITASVLMTGAVLMAVTFALGETAVPFASAKAHALKEGRASGPGEAAPGSPGSPGAAGRWLRDGAYFLYMEEAFGDDSFGGVTMYQLNDDYHLARIIEARRAEARGREWRLTDASVSELRAGRLEIERHERLVLARAMPELPGGVGATSARRSDLSRMNIAQLMDYIEFLRASDLPSAPQELALWTRFSAALATLVMLLLAVPWLFFSTRSVAAGKRLFFAIIIGLSYMIGSRIIGDAAIVYRIPPVSGAFLPIIVFAAAGIWWLRRRRIV